MKISERRLISTVEVEIFGDLTNSIERLSRLENSQILIDSLAEIIRMEKANKARKNVGDKDKDEINLSKSLNRYSQLRGKLSKLKKNYFSAILYCKYDKIISDSKG